jgi:spore maturation protein SpmA
MVLNVIWIGFILIGFVVALHQAGAGRRDHLHQGADRLFDTAKTGFDISLGLVGIMSLWLGIMKIGEQAGMMALFARGIDPLFRRCSRTSRRATRPAAAS